MPHGNTTTADKEMACDEGYGSCDAGVALLHPVTGPAKGDVSGSCQGSSSGGGDGFAVNTPLLRIEEKQNCGGGGPTEGFTTESDEEEGGVSLKHHASRVRQVFPKLAEGLGPPKDNLWTPSALRHQPFYTL